MGPFKTIYTLTLRTKVTLASFFENGEVLYAETLDGLENGLLATQHVIVDLRSQDLRERVYRENPNEARTFFYALTDQVLLGSEMDGDTRRVRALTRVILPDYKEMRRVPFAPNGLSEAYRHDTDIFTSADRKCIAYASGHSIVLRRAADLQINWTSPVEREFFGVSRLTLSPDGNRLAAAIVDATYFGYQRKYYTGLYDGKTGALLTMLSMNGDGGLGLSPNGKFVAVGTQALDSKTRAIRLGVDVYEAASGRRVAELLHDTVRAGRLQALNANFGYNGIRFTSDGRYLVTSGNNATKIWEIMA